MASFSLDYKVTVCYGVCQQEKHTLQRKGVDMKDEQIGELVLTSKGHNVVAQSQPADSRMLLTMAVQAGLDGSQITTLANLHFLMADRQAQLDFYAAMANFQAMVPPIRKAGKVAFNGTKFNFARLEHIVETIKDSLRDNGLSYRWETDAGDKGITVTCIACHIGGHSVKSSFCAGKDDSGKKNVIQSWGSTLTYLKRYTLTAVFGLMVAEMDDDSVEGGHLNEYPEDAFSKNLPLWKSRIEQGKITWDRLANDIESGSKQKMTPAQIETLQNIDVIKQQPPNAPANHTPQQEPVKKAEVAGEGYPAGKFSVNLSLWVGSVKAGKITTDQLIETINSKADSPLTAAQTQKLREATR